MAVTSEQIQQWFQANPNASDTDIYNAMQTYGVDTSQLSSAMNFNPEEVQSRYQAQQASFAPEVASTAPYTDANYSTPATPPPSIYESELADRSFADLVPASMGIAAPTPQATTPNKPPAPVGGLQMVGESASAPAVGGLQSVANAKYNQYTDQGITDWLQDFATKNTRGAYNADEYDVSGQLKDALKKYNADPDQVSRIINSGKVVPIYGGSVAGGTDVNLKDYANEFAMATSKNPLVDANKRITLDPALATQAAQNELDTLFDPNKGSLMPIKNADFESGGKYYGRIGERDKMIADWYKDPANQATIAAAQKSVFDKYGVPTDQRLAPRAISQNLARTEIKPAAAVDPNDYSTYEDYSAAQNAASLKAFQDKAATYKKYGIDIMAKEDPQQLHRTSGQVSLANLKAGLAGRDPQAAANFYGMTLENYNNLKSGNKTKPMGQFADVYGTQLLSPVEQIAAQTARGQGIGTMSPQTAALAKKYPEVFNNASQKWNNYLTTKYPGTLEYESALSGPMQYSSTGVTAPKITGTSSMYIIDPKTRKIVKNPSYKPKGGLSSVGKK